MDEAKVTLEQNGKEGIQDERCKCNKLLCVTKGNNIEIKCNKCKRMMTIKTSGILDVEIF